MAPTRFRISGTERRVVLVRAALALARDEGVGALTLARVATAGGVSKPVAYSHFGSLHGLLSALHEAIAGEYERVVIHPLADRAAQGDPPDDLLHGLCEAYVDCSLGYGGLQDDIGAAILSLEPEDRAARTDVAAQYTDFVVSVFGYAPDDAYRIAVAFLGAADRLVDAVLGGTVDRTAAVRTLEALFRPPSNSSPDLGV